MVVHMMGNPARLQELREIADEHGLHLIEDCCQAFGAAYRGRPIGSVGDVGGGSASTSTRRSRRGTAAW